MSVVNYKKRLSKMKKSFKKSAEEYETMFSSVPPSEYMGQLSSMKIKESGSGKLMLSQVYVITEGEFEGRKVFANNMLEGSDEEKTAKCWAFVRKLFDALGYEAPSDVTEIPDLIEEINEAEIDVQLNVVENKDYPNNPNVYVNPASGSVADEEEDPEEEDPEDPDYEDPEEEDPEEEDPEEEDPEEEDPEESDDDEELRERAVAFAITWDLTDVTEDSSIDEVIEAINNAVEEGGPWDLGDLEEADVELLEEELGIEGATKKPKPQKKKTKKTTKKATKKTTKKSTKKSTKKKKK